MDRSPDSTTGHPGATRGTPVQQVLLDDHALARHARTTLAAADYGVLVLGSQRWDAAGRRASEGSYRVGLRDDGGEPLVFTRHEGAVDLAAREGRQAGLLVQPRTPGGVVLRLYGRLGDPYELRPDRPRCPKHEEIPAAVNALRVDRVVVGCPHRDQAGRDLPLTLYGEVVPDQLAAAIPRMVSHLNEDHEPDLRAFVSASCRLPEESVAAAQLIELGAHGMRLTWIDECGGHEQLIGFPSPATTVPQLLAAMRDRFQDRPAP